MTPLFSDEPQAEDRVEIEGYAAVFGAPDQTGDIIRPGAFANIEKTEKLIPTPQSRVMMLYQHAAEQPIGRWHHMKEDQNGLFVRGSLFIDTSQGADLYRLLRGGALDGLSIGFKPERARRTRDGKRELLRIALWEISIVTFPMAPGARITHVGEPGVRSPRNLLEA
ncbi:MAG: HK97 family phage prohead protease [Pseudomonadota bacterium]